MRALAPRQIITGQRTRLVFHILERAETHDFAAALAGAGAQVEDAVGGEHDLRFMLDDHERVAGVAQPLHDTDHTPHIARVQADRRFVEHEQRVDERGAERGGEVDALHFSARERARLAVERQVTEADLGEVRQARADFGQQQVDCLI